MTNNARTDLTSQLVNYIKDGKTAQFPDQVILEAKHHILDTMAAMVVGSTLAPGKAAVKYAQAVGGVPEATVVCSDLSVNAATAAMANGMMAHADEIDDSHSQILQHPGCGVVPAALAMAERNGVTGANFINAVIVGYDCSVRVARALGGRYQPDPAFKKRSRGLDYGVMGTSVGAAAAACVASNSTEGQINSALWYAVHQLSGLSELHGDPEHTGKAFGFAGMPARNAVSAVMMAEAGFTSPRNVFDGDSNLLHTFGVDPDAQKVVEELGTRFDLISTAFKRHPIGGPLQAPVGALLGMIMEHGLDVNRVDSVTVYTRDGDTPRFGANQPSPDLNLRYLCSVALLDKTLSFGASHDHDRMEEPSVRALMKRIDVKADPTLYSRPSPHEEIVEVLTADGRVLKNRVQRLPEGEEGPRWHRLLNYAGPGRPPSTKEITDKASNLLEEVMTSSKAGDLIEAVLTLDTLCSIKDLASTLVVIPSSDKPL